MIARETCLTLVQKKKNLVSLAPLRGDEPRKTSGLSVLGWIPHHSRLISHAKLGETGASNRLRSDSRDAFTLIEMLVVLMLIAILSTSVALSLRPFLIRYSLSQATQQIAMNDAAARATARRLNQPAILSLDKVGRRVAFQCGEVVRQYELPKNVSIDQSLGGLTEIRIEPDGRSLSYAVAVANGQAKRWMVIAGGSGQSLSVESDSVARELVAP